MNTRPLDAHVFRFGVFELDTDSRELRRHGLKIRLPDQSFQILNTLLRRPGEVVTRDELRGVLWTPDTFVDFEVGLNSAIRKLREALDDSAENPRFVETLPRRGYRFVASVTAGGAVSAPPILLENEPTVVPVSDRAVARTAPGPVPRVGRGLHLASWPAAGLLLTVALAGADMVYRRVESADRSAGPAAERIRSLVVLPFENLTGDASQDSFVDHVTDEVTSHLAQVAGLDVTSRTSARRYEQSVKRLPEIGKELNVEGVVEGAVVRSGAAVRITAKLIRVATDRHVWTQTYDGDSGHILALQQRIASDVSVAAGLAALSTPVRAARAVNTRAYDLYLKGVTARGLLRHEAFRTAVVYLEEAIAIQPDFGDAYAELALTQTQFLFGGPFTPRETIPKAEAAARRALQLDDTRVRAHLALGQILSLYYWRWAEGHKALQRAVELQGTRDELSHALIESLIRFGRFSEAIAVAERTRKVDPLSVNAQIAVGNAYRAAGQPDRALEELRLALKMIPGNNRVHFQLGATLALMGRLDDAIPELEVAARSPGGHNSRLEAYLGYAYAAAGRTDDARDVLKELESHRPEQYVSSFGISLIYDALGEKDPALAALEHAHEERAVEFAQMMQYPAFKTIGADPRFLAVMQDVALPRWHR